MYMKNLKSFKRCKRRLEPLQEHTTFLDRKTQHHKDVSSSCVDL